jgi:hypothetical protein
VDGNKIQNCTHEHKTERESGSKGSERETTLQVESGDASGRGQWPPLVALATARLGAIGAGSASLRSHWRRLGLAVGPSSGGSLDCQSQSMPVRLKGLELTKFLSTLKKPNCQVMCY